MAEENKLYLVKAEVLPEAVKKTIKAKELLRQGRCKTINEAVKRLQLSRSAFYKYKDYVFNFNEVGGGQLLTLYLLLEHRSGVLGQVLNSLAREGTQLLFVNQGLPMQGVVNVALALDVSEMEKETEALLDSLRIIEGVVRVQIVGRQ